MFGAGWGNLHFRDEAGKVKTEVYLLGAVGVWQELLTWRQIDLDLKTDAFLTELEAGAGDRLPKTAGDAQRVRVMMEGRTVWALSEESSLTPAGGGGGTGTRRRWVGGGTRRRGRVGAHEAGIGRRSLWAVLVGAPEGGFDE